MLNIKILCVNFNTTDVRDKEGENDRGWGGWLGLTLIYVGRLPLTMIVTFSDKP